jgi:DNA invertase Pin-like site-specific DNA recombinase
VARFAAIYCRVSTDLQEEKGTSLEHQLEANIAYAHSLGYETHERFTASEALSGKHDYFYSRPGLNKLREAIRNKEVEAFICHKVDRLARDAVHVWIIYEECRKNGVAFLFTQEQFDDTPMGRAMLSMKATWAEMERAAIVDRTQRGKRARAERGGKLIPGVRPPFGYVWDGSGKDRLIPAPDHRSEVMRRIFRDLAGGKSARKISLELNAEGVPSPSGKPGAKWYQGTITQLANHPVYKGEARALATTKDSIAGRSGSRTELMHNGGIVLPKSAEIIPEPLVTVALWETVQQQMVRNRVESSRRSGVEAQGKLLRAGGVVCAYCGYNLHVRAAALDKNGDKYHLYVCPDNQAKRYNHPNVTISTRVLDAEIWGIIERVFTNPAIIQEFLDKRANDPHADDREALSSILTELVAKEGNLVRVLGTLTNAAASDALVTQLNEIGKRKVAVESQLHDLMLSYERWQQERENVQNAYRWIDRMGERLRFGSNSEIPYEIKRTIIYAMGIKVRVYNRDVTPRYVLEGSIPFDVAETAQPSHSFLAIANETSCSSIRNIAITLTREDIIGAESASIGIPSAA